MPQLIYRVVEHRVWARMQALGVFDGSEDDYRDGFIHFSTASQLPETLFKHYRGKEGLCLLAIDVSTLGDSLRWEVSRKGAKFPHLYAPLQTDQVVSSVSLALDEEGLHQLPPGLLD